MRHTPGPWRVDYAKTGTLVSVIPGGPYRQAIASVYARDEVLQNGKRVGVTDNEEGMNNARLIAASPDLLEALKDVSNAYQEMFDVMPVAWQTIDHIVQEAIAKAEGRD